jgi:alpha-tubulin suppressor-like RCC1 family protein
MGITTNISYPQLVKGSLKVKDIALGWNHTLLLTEDNYVYSSGHGKQG